jgi:hypothetical protein
MRTKNNTVVDMTEMLRKLSAESHADWQQHAEVCEHY